MKKFELDNKPDLQTNLIFQFIRTSIQLEFYFIPILGIGPGLTWFSFYIYKTNYWEFTHGLEQL